MNAVQLLREQFNSAHSLMELTMKDVTVDAAHFNNTGKALPVGAAYAHAVAIEDLTISQLMHLLPISHKKALTGLSEPMPALSEWEKYEAWTKRVKIDLKKCKAYAKKVYKRSDEYLSLLKDRELNKKIELSGMGEYELFYILNNFILLHTANLTGEISAAKGVQGLRGYPF